MTEDKEIEHSYLRYKDHIHNIIYGLSNDHQITMDVVQQTYLEFIIDNRTTDLTKSRLISNAIQVLYKELLITNHIALDTIDQSTELRYFYENTEKTNINSTHPALRKLQLTVERSLNSVTTATKELLILYFIENLSIVEISSITQRSVIDIKVNLHHSIIIFDMILVNNMKRNSVATTKHCPIYLKKYKHFFYSQVKIPKMTLNSINYHISNCCECLDKNKLLKTIGMVLNVIPIIKAAPSLEESVCLNLKTLKHYNLKYQHSMYLLH